MTVQRAALIARNAATKPSFMRGMWSLLSPAGPSSRLSVLLFHKVPTKADPLAPAELDLRRFEQMLDFVGENANVLALSDANAALQRGTLPQRAVALTFDDGYAEWIDNVAPALLRRGMPATFFITTGQFEGGVLWHERILSAVRALPRHGANLPAGLTQYTDLDLPNCRERLVERLQERLKYAPLSERIFAIEHLESQAIEPLLLPSGFNANSVRNLHSQGFEIGAHTVHHPILNECTVQQARAEIADSKAELELLIGGAVHAFAYPNGRPGTDFGFDHVRMVKESGYQLAVTTSVGAAKASTDPFQLPRFTPWGLSSERMAFQIVKNLMTAPASVSVRSETRDEGASDVRCLMLASTFAPIHGGPAVAHETLCRHMPAASIRVLAASSSYQTGQEVPGWREYDAQQVFPVDRIELLCPPLLPPPASRLAALWRLLAKALPRHARVLYRAAQVVRQHDINVVCVGELASVAWLGIALKKFFGCKLIVCVQGEEVTTRIDGEAGRQRQQFLLAADKIVAVSAFVFDAVSALGVPPESIVLIQDGVDIDHFTPGARDAGLIARHDLAGKQIILTVARLLPRKGIDMAVRSMRQIIAVRPDVRYLIVGEGAMREEIAQLVRDEGLEDHVILVGEVTDDALLRYLRSCDLFLMPNRTMPDGDTEGFGLVFREANACKKPVIGGRAGGVVEAVADGVSGLLVDGNNPEEIANAVERILGDQALADRLSEGGYALARQNSAKAAAHKFLRACERLLKRTSL